MLLLVATATGLVLRSARPEWHLRDYFARLTSWWIVTSVMLVVVVTAAWSRGALFVLLIALALIECTRALWSRQRLLLLPALLWIVVGLGHLQWWLLRGDQASLLLFVWVLLLTQLNDIAQYFAGKALGRHRIVPQLSPNKTWEGFIGGVVFSVVTSAVLTPRLLPLSWLQAIGFGALLSIGGFAGDILFSGLKRRAGIKDFGSVLPGQGGVLDRLDSATVTAPLIAWYLLAVSS
ncbi:MAG: phosphatidate cytidylyltransferase [Pseudomonadota bacterium]